ncbi:type II secretion system protein GspG [Ferroacidibacillus organovorans]|uniref:Type II secretion system protein GspG C-terminal domain-containing protein n=1 Tax=Ferroacidibacillus organovorans TaxID=1765683 RepID=A0A853KC66_9BACL|nr:type II secretion system protein GspG [Ferroacidibacillus organovorans]KYP80730.1 hypothetical protein AYJ22_10240 [Ferroacidibacillus organovorans]OAG93944.1 hypothetical protein AYW79_07905 [Ferroacidibacillus organovorans]
MKSLHRKFRKFASSAGEKGVTLIELLAVVVILAIIAAIAIPVVLNSIVQAKVNTTKQDMAIITEALDRYAAYNDGVYPMPSGTATLASLLTSGTIASGSSTTFGGPYMQSLPQDAWSDDFFYGYSTHGHSFVLATQAAVSGTVTIIGTPSTTLATGDPALYVTNKNSVPQTVASTSANSGTTTSGTLLGTTASSLSISNVSDAGSGAN